MRVFIFGGTTEGRQLASYHALHGDDVTVSVATEIGAEELSQIADSLTILIGRMDSYAMTEAISGFDFVIDATHPYATEVTENIKKACAATGIEYRRMDRDTDFDGELPDRYFTAVNHVAAAEHLSHTKGNILLTTGSKNIADYADTLRERLYVRVLPTHEAIAVCEECGIAHSHIIAMHGPFSAELNIAMINQYDIEHIVTKKTGALGGFPEKVRAAVDTDTELVIINNETGGA